MKCISVAGVWSVVVLGATVDVCLSLVVVTADVTGGSTNVVVCASVVVVNAKADVCLIVVVAGAIVVLVGSNIVLVVVGSTVVVTCSAQLAAKHL